MGAVFAGVRPSNKAWQAFALTASIVASRLRRGIGGPQAKFLPPLDCPAASAACDDDKGRSGWPLASAGASSHHRFHWISK